MFTAPAVAARVQKRAATSKALRIFRFIFFSSFLFVTRPKQALDRHREYVIRISCYYI